MGSQIKKRLWGLVKIHLSLSDCFRREGNSEKVKVIGQICGKVLVIGKKLQVRAKFASND